MYSFIFWISIPLGLANKVYLVITATSARLTIAPIFPGYESGDRTQDDDAQALV